LIADLRSEERTLLIASHDLTEIERLVDRVIVMDGGTIRESLAIDHANTERRRYRIQLQSSVPGAAQLLGLPAAETDTVFTVELADARELSARLAALLELGAIIEAVTPADGLEERVRAALLPEPKA
jgi:ABC-type multidrug transport system ATPase subunit